MSSKKSKKQDYIPYESKRLIKYWNIESANYMYRLEEWRQDMSYLLSYKPYPFPDLPPPSYYWKTIGTGNLTWAKKNAAHYKIKIEEEEGGE